MLIKGLNPKRIVVILNSLKRFEPSATYEKVTLKSGKKKFLVTMPDIKFACELEPVLNGILVTYPMDVAMFNQTKLVAFQNFLRGLESAKA